MSDDHGDRRIFAEWLPTLATPFARRTARLAGIVRLFGHSVGGRPSERLMARLGMPVSDTTILRSVKECAGVQPNRAVVRVAGIDEWAWRKGMTFGTVIVDLERRQVVDCWRIARPGPRQTGSRGIRKSRSSAAIALASMRTPRAKARRRRDRSLTAFTS
jgi:hypothetical protein